MAKFTKKKRLIKKKAKMNESQVEFTKIIKSIEGCLISIKRTKDEKDFDLFVDPLVEKLIKSNYIRERTNDIRTNV